MPNNTSSPVKRPGLGRRAVSSHAVVTRSNSNELSESHTSKAPVHHKAHRAHVVGGHRNHHRNPSLGKNLSKLKLFQLGGPETTGRNHHRKKSAPATPVGSPKAQGHVRWDGDLEDHPKNHSMKRNNSTPVLRRNNSAVGKKALVSQRPLSSTGKKTVGFELGDDDNDDAEWEDTTQSPESTRRNSVVPSNPSVENTQVLVDPLTFVKRPYPQIPRATSLPESITNKFARNHSDLDEEDVNEDADADEQEDSKQGLDQSVDQGDIASRLLSPSHSAKAPPAMSSISAMAKPSPKDPASRSASVNLAQEKNNRRTMASSNPSFAMAPGSQPQATSSSMEGGVSRFIVSNKSANQASSRTDSDPNTPSSFLPHYHPQTPPSPNRGAGKAAASPARPLGADLPSRTQQKLWLQRTATLNDSPPDNHGATPTTSSAAMEMAVNQPRPGAGAFEVNRGINGSARPGGAVGQDSESRQTRKAYEKVSLELTAVRRFQSPTGDSFNRLRAIARSSKSRVVSAEQASALGKPVKSAPSLPLLQQGKRPSGLGSSSESKSQLRDPQSSTSEDPATQSESADVVQATRSSHPSHRILSTSDEAVHGHGLTGDQDTEDFPQVSQADMMIRRMWESREVATSG